MDLILSALDHGVCLYVHGGGHSTISVRTITVGLAKRGVNVLSINYRQVGVYGTIARVAFKPLTFCLENSRHIMSFHVL